MIQLTNPEKSQWAKLTKRPSLPSDDLQSKVGYILDNVKTRGDEALTEYAQLFDNVNLERLQVTSAEIQTAINSIDDDLKSAIQLAKQNIYSFHASQKEDAQIIETRPGVKCWRKSVAIEKVGIYIPGGTAPLFSTVLMLGIPAAIAGCREVVLCSPPNNEGNIHPAILYTANLVGIEKMYKVGGAQAIAAMSFGTETIPAVHKLFGPGNQYVTKAKEMALLHGLAIDMPAGPSEVLVIADSTSNPDYIAADLLSQAEHGTDSQVVLLSTDADITQRTLLALNSQLDTLPRKLIAEKALEHSYAITFEEMDCCIEFSNFYAPEHLIIASENAHQYIDRIINAGSVFLGNFSCESAGDYASGTNHTLPTSGFAKQYSGTSLDSFVKKITFQMISKSGLRRIGPAIEIMAEAEGLMAHKNAVSIRLKSQ